MIRTQLEQIAGHLDLTPEEMADVIGLVMDGKVAPAQIAGLFMALRTKGETVGEVVGAARAMRDRAVRLPLAVPADLDTCGTGGDNSGTINLSTAAALVAAAAGLKVAKHGNRSISSKSGSADVLDAMGIPTDLAPEAAAQRIAEHNFAFLFAPLYHPAMKAVMPVRRELVVRTIFNMLGPLTNPANARHQLVGAPSSAMAEKMALALRDLGLVRAMVVHARLGVDEISPEGETMVWELRDGAIRTSVITAGDFDLNPAKLDSIKGGDPAMNADIIRRVFVGEWHPARTAVVMNAAAALYVAGAAEDLRAGARRAEQLIDSGAVMETVKALAEKAVVSA
jgi:anthranilate phosphoribosyltransferase